MHGHRESVHGHRVYGHWSVCTDILKMFTATIVNVLEDRCYVCLDSNNIDQETMFDFKGQMVDMTLAFNLLPK